MHRWGRLWLAWAALLISGCSTNNELRTPGLVELLPTRMILPTLMPTASSLSLQTPTPQHTVTPSPAPPTATPTATPAQTVNVVIAIQPIPAGAVIPVDALAVVNWPAAIAPAEAVSHRSRASGRVALTDIACYEPLLAPALAVQTLSGSGTPITGEICPLLPESLDLEALVPIVILTRYVDAGMAILPHTVALRAWPAALVPPGAITTLAEAIGQIAQQGIFREQPLLNTRIGLSHTS